MEVSRPLSIRDRMFRMYVVYNPEKIPEIDSILAKFQGREIQVLETMVSKYGPEPDEMRVQGALRRHRNENQPQPNQVISSTQPDPEGLKRRIARLYRFYNPSKLKELDELFRKYAGQEPKILEQCIKKYGPEPTQQMLDAKIAQERTRLVAANDPQITAGTNTSGSVAPLPNTMKTPLSTDAGKAAANPPQPKHSGRASLIQKLKVESDSDDEGTAQRPPSSLATDQKPLATTERPSPPSPSQRRVESPEKSRRSHHQQEGASEGPMLDRQLNVASPRTGPKIQFSETTLVRDTPSEVKPFREVIPEVKPSPETASHSRPPAEVKSEGRLETETEAKIPKTVAESKSESLVANPAGTVAHNAKAAKEKTIEQKPLNGKTSSNSHLRPGPEIGKTKHGQHSIWTPPTPWVGPLDRSREASPPVREPTKRTNSSDRKHPIQLTPRRGTSPQLETPHSRASPRVYVVDRRSFSPNIEQPPPLETVFGVPIKRIKSPVVFRRSATPVPHSNEGPKEVVEVSSAGPRPLSSYSTFVIREAGKPSSWARCTTKAHPIFDVEESGVVVEYIKDVPTGEAVKEQKALSKRLARPRMYVPRKKGSA